MEDQSGLQKGKRPERIGGLFSVGIAVRFALSLGAVYLLLTVEPIYQTLVIPFTRFTAWLAAVVAAALRLSVTVSGTLLSNSRSSVNVGQGCDAIDVVAILLAATVATPAALARRLSFLGFGLVVILALNIARLLTLLYADSLSPTFMDILHVYVWPVILLFACLGLWYYWFEARATA